LFTLAVLSADGQTKAKRKWPREPLMDFPAFLRLPEIKKARISAGFLVFLGSPYWAYQEPK
jgi:hypothetical protein